MIAVAVTVLFAIATLVAVSVNISSLRRAVAAYGDLRRALASCAAAQDVFIRMENTGRPAPHLRVVSPARRPLRQPVPLNGLRAAA